jgi:hypothetical protein
MTCEDHELLGAARIALRTTCTGLDGSGYFVRPEDNLIEAVTEELWDSVRKDLEGGKGDELRRKFRAPHSSSALAANAFAPLRGHISLPIDADLAEITLFEQERSAWAPGWKPTLDVIIDRPVVFVESKFIQYLRRTNTEFSEAFPNHARKQLEPAAADVFDRVRHDRCAYDPVDAPQLLKHFSRCEARSH